jgi:peptidoglycan/xylan/chitin deacetylase (PgdA/CDA1 family)
MEKCSIIRFYKPYLELPRIRSTDVSGGKETLSAKLAKVEERLTKLQNEMAELITYLSAPHKAPPSTQRLGCGRRSRSVQAGKTRGSSVILRRKKWGHFRTLANQNKKVFAAAPFLALLAASLFLFYSPTLKGEPQGILQSTLAPFGIASFAGYIGGTVQEPRGIAYLPSGYTSIQISITFEPFEATLHYTLNAGDRYTAPAHIDVGEKTYAFTKWTDGVTQTARTFTESGDYTIIYGQSIERSPRGVISIAFDDGYQDQFDYAYPILQTKGVHATFYLISNCVIGNVPSWMAGAHFMNAAEALQLQASGNEIASHSKDHAQFNELSDQQIRDECTESKQTLTTLGLNIENFAYPYGSTNTHIDSIVLQYYQTARYGTQGQMQLPFTGGIVYATQVLNNPWTAYNVIDNAIASNSWAIIYFHHVTPTGTESFATSTIVLAQVLDYALSKGVTLLTVKGALDLSSLVASGTKT